MMCKAWKTQTKQNRRMTKHMMHKMLAAALVCMGPVVATGGHAAYAAAAEADPVTKDIVETALRAGSFKTLAAALQAAGLVDTLKGSGPFTVFAPTDAAFAKLPAGTVESLLKPENKEKLIAILTYHVVPGDVRAAQASTLTSAKTVNGQELTLATNGGTVLVNGAAVTAADIVCSNGVIHVIDTVVLPK